MEQVSMRTLTISLILLLGVSACGGGENPAEADPQGTAAAPQAPPPPASPWNELPLAPNTFFDQTGTYRTDTIDIPLGPGGELEYKVDLEEGAAIVYQWNALNLTDPEQLWSEFHGHTERVGNAQGDLMFYRNAAGASEQGLLVAPFKGIHGWYLRNDSDENITVRLEVAGYYELIGI
jgi:hypothetical protein